MKHEIVLERNSLRRTNPLLLHRQVQEIVERGLGGDRGKQWRLSSPILNPIVPIGTPEGWTYRVPLSFEWIGKPADDGKVAKSFAKVSDCVAKTAPTKGNWFVPGYTPTGVTLVTINDVDAIAEINVDKGDHFENLYGLDHQINVLLCSLETAKQTRYQKRFHVVLYGKPGCGKSEILRGLKSMVGEEGVIEFDGTQTTAAGAISVLMDAAILPPLLIIEEIEKVPDQAFMWLLGALDGRAEIRKITNNGVRQRHCPFVCAATVNDLALFQSRHEGAMASRFPHQLYCPRPGEEIVRRILRREVASVNGDLAWVDPALRYCVDIERNPDPRRAIAVCLTGRDHLLDGSFQKSLYACQHKEEE